MKWFKVLFFIAILIILSLFIYFFILPKVNKPNTITLPTLTNMNINDAINYLDNYKFKYEIIYEKGKKDTVLYTYPLENTIVYEHSLVTLYVGENDLNIIKDYKGCDITLIKDEIKNLNYIIEYQDNNMLPNNYIISQNSYNKNDTIKFIVVRNNNTILMPNLIGSNIKILDEYFNNTFITFEIEYLESPFIDNIIIYQSVKENTYVNINNPFKIKLIVAKFIDYE